MTSKIDSYGKFVLVPSLEAGLQISAKVSGIVLSRTAYIRPAFHLMKSGRHIFFPITLAPLTFQVPFGTDVLISNAFTEQHPQRKEAIRIAKSGGRIALDKEARLSILPEMASALRFAHMDPGYVMRGPTDLEELDTRLSQG